MRVGQDAMGVGEISKEALRREVDSTEGRSSVVMGRSKAQAVNYH